MAKLAIKPLADRVVIEPAAAEQKTSSPTPPKRNPNKVK